MDNFVATFETVHGDYRSTQRKIINALNGWPGAALQGSLKL